MEEVIDTSVVETSEPLEEPLVNTQGVQVVEQSSSFFVFVVFFSYACGESSFGKLPETKGRILPTGQTTGSFQTTGAKSSAYAKAKVGQANQTFTFQAQAISDISVPLVDIETRNLDPGWS